MIVVELPPQPSLTQIRQPNVFDSANKVDQVIPLDPTYSYRLVFWVFSTCRNMWCSLQKLKKRIPKEIS